MELPFTPVPKPRNQPQFKDREGQVFGRLTVLAYAGRSSKKNRMPSWFCRCTCGTIVKVSRGDLTTGNTMSCGCLRREVTSARVGTHRSSQSHEYRIYATAKDRCTRKKSPAYKDYGGRGIEFRFNSFEQFIKEVGRKPTPKHTLDRIDNNGHYEPGNVRWATPIEQSSNTRNNRRITYKGRSLIAPQWSRMTGISTGTIYGRIYIFKWCIECALTVPPRGPRCRHGR